MKCQNLTNVEKKHQSTNKSNLPTSGRSSTKSNHRKYRVYDAKSLESAIVAVVCYGICLALIILVIFFPSLAHADTKSISVEGYSVDQIVSAIYIIEGAEKTNYPYGIKSIPCETLPECKRIAENTVVNNIQRWHKSKTDKSYFEFLASRYAPVEVHPLNKNWLPNLLSVLGVAK